MQDDGMELLEATLHAVRMRLRPILMTSIAFGLGVLPLAISNGAGSGSQNAIGIGVLSGMLSATFLGIFFVPVFFMIVRGMFARQAPVPLPHTDAANAAPQPVPEGH
ncbi:MAG: efflux RND transporter permease subunit [Janthinobacterium lividum]